MRRACLALSVALGCTVDPPSAAPATAAAPERCEAMPRATCMQAPQCTLEKLDPTPASEYRCRPARPPCEDGIRQAELGRPEAQQACRARPGCEVAEERCYCRCRGVGRAAAPDGAEAEDCDCECGHGPPATCRPAP